MGSVTEWALFAERFYEAILSVDERVHLTVRASGIKGRRLISADPSSVLFGDFRIEMPEFEVRETAGVSEPRADSEAITRRIIRRIFELFNWTDPGEWMLQCWQQRLIQRPF
jgi:hypothetical protein